MLDLTLTEIAEWLGADLVGVDPATRVSAPVTADSRRVEPGGLFLALPGEHADGHDFVAAAAHAGAVAAIVERPVPDVACLVVSDVRQAVTELARRHVARLAQLTVVGLTGSSGKTSTKDLLAQVLAQHGPTVAPEGSYNNELGVPLTLLRAGADTRFLIVEMGARGPGHIASLCAIAQPSIGMVLNVGSAHVGEFGSRAAIAMAKGELVDALPASGLAVLNADDPTVRAMSARSAAPVLTFGESTGADVRATGVRLDEQACASFDLVAHSQQVPVTLKVVGEHQVGNALAAAAVALHLGLTLDEIAAALSAATTRSRWRMETHQRPDGVTVINDAYNANPESTRAALKSLVAIGAGKRRTVAVLGEMLELGGDSVREHDAIGRLVVRLNVSQLVVVGIGARTMHLAAGMEGSWDGETVAVAEAEQALAWVRSYLQPGDVVLVKASRAVGLERVAEGLLE